MLKALLKGQRGFTLIELLAVMAIVGTLAGIVATQVSGSGDTSRDVQTQQDATTVGTSVADYFSDQDGAGLLRPRTVRVLDEEGITLTTSSKWPELTITEAYPDVFPPSRAVIAAIRLFTEDNEPSVLSIKGLLENYNAVDFDRLLADSFIVQVPDGASQVTNGLAVYLWLLKKTTAAGGATGVGSRDVEVFKLVTVQEVEGSDLIVLAYQRIFGADIINDLPAGIPGNAVTEEITPVDITLEGTDPDDDPLSFTVIADPAHGTLTGTAPDLTYTPDVGFVDATDSFAFKVSDGISDSEPVIVFIKVFGAGKTPPSGDPEPPFPDADFNHIHDQLDAEMAAAPNAFFQVIVLVTRTLDQTDLDTLGAAIGLSTLPVELTFAGPSVVVTLQPNEIELLADQSLVVRIEKNDPFGL